MEEDKKEAENQETKKELSDKDEFEELLGDDLEPEEVEEISEPYYKSNDDGNTCEQDYKHYFIYNQGGNKKQCCKKSS